MSVTFIPDTERSIYERLELERVRGAVDLLSLLNGVVSTVMNVVLLVFAFNGSIVFLPGRMATFVHVIYVTFGVIAGVAIGPVIARLPFGSERRRIYAAAFFHAIFMQIMVSAIVLAYAYCVGVDAFVLILLASMINLILLTGSFFQTTRSLLLSMLALHGVDVVLLLFAPVAPGYAGFGRERLLAIILSTGMVHAAVSIFYYWSSSVKRNAQRLADMQIAIERARMLDELKDQFISSVNHELRNPIMAAQNFAGVLEKGSDSLPPEARLALIQRLRTSLHRLATLVNSVLDMRRMDQGMQDLHPVAIALKAAITAAAESLDPRDWKMERRDLNLHIPDDFQVFGDETYLQQIIVNVLSNAIKYSPAATPIDVVAHVIREGKKQSAKVMVRDYGLGIPPNNIPLLFNRFARLPRDIASTVMGNGLGLYLCRVYAEAMGGSIAVESTGIEGEGVTVVLYLPLPPMPPTREGEGAHVVSSQAS